MSEFSDRPFVAGSLTGLRTFKIDKYGRLTGAQVPAVWVPDENIARCLKGKVSGSLTFPTMSSMVANWPFGGGGGGGSYASGGTVETKPAEPKPVPVSLTKKAKHHVAELSCTCGFYAYFDNDGNAFHHPGQMKGLIEGYGVTTVGTRGFRAEKARLQALIVPKKLAGPLVARVLHNYPDVPVFPHRAAALHAFPLTPPAFPSPDTDADFWTREALA